MLAETVKGAMDDCSRPRGKLTGRNGSTGDRQSPQKEGGSRKFFRAPPPKPGFPPPRVPRNGHFEVRGLEGPNRQPPARTLFRALGSSSRVRYPPSQPGSLRRLKAKRQPRKETDITLRPLLNDGDCPMEAGGYTPTRKGHTALWEQGRFISTRPNASAF